MDENIKVVLEVIGVLLIIFYFLIMMPTRTQETTGIQAENEKTTHDDYANGYFTVIAEWYEDFKTYRIVYANDTKVKYFISSFDSWNARSNAITPLYNVDGTLQIYEE